MGLNAMGMGFMFTARDLATGTIMKVRGSLKSLSAESKLAAAQYELGMQRMRRGALALGVAVVGMFTMLKTAGDFGKFQYTMAAVGQVTGATASQMEELSKAAIQAGIDTQFSPREAAEGLQALGAAGMNATQAMRALNPVLDLAAGSLGQLGVAGAAENVVGVLNAFSLTADKAANVTDKLVRVTQLTNFQARDFQVAISQASSSASAANQSFESMLATLGMLRNANMHASVAATAYRNAMTKLSADKKSWKELAKHGVKVMDAEGKKIRDLGSIMADLAPRLEKLKAKEKGLAIQRIFGLRGMKVYSSFVAQHNKLVKEGTVVQGDYAGAHRRLVSSLQASAGAAAQNRDALLKTAEGQRILLKGSWETTQIMLGKLAVPVVLPALKALTDTLNVFIQIMNVIPGPVRHLMASFLGVTLAIKAMKGAFLIFRGLGALRMMKGLAGATAEVGTEAAKATTKVGLMGRMTARYGQQYMSQVSGFVSRLASIGGAAIPIIFAVTSYFQQKHREEAQRQQEARQQAQRSFQAYKAAVAMAKELREATAKQLAVEVRAGAKTAEKAEMVYRKYLGLVTQARERLINQQRAYHVLSARLGENHKDVVKARGEWIKQSGKFEALYRAQMDSEANLAKFQIRTARTTAEKQLFGRRILVQRTFKFEKMLENYRKWRHDRRLAISRIENVQERLAAERRFKLRKKREFAGIQAYKQQSARLALRWGLGEKDILRRKGQAAKLRKIVANLRDEGVAPTHAYMGAMMLRRDFAYAAHEGRLPQGRLTQADLKQFIQFQKHYRAARGMTDVSEEALMTAYHRRQTPAPAVAVAGAVAGPVPYPFATGEHRTEAALVEGVQSAVGSVAEAIREVNAKPTVFQVMLDGKKLAQVVTKHQEGRETESDGTGAVTASAGVQGAG